MLKELAALRRRVSELEKEKQFQTEIEQEKAQITHNLGERVKELNCLYGVSELIEAHGSSIDNILQGVAELLPISWQYPQITCARVLHDGQEYKSSNFNTSKWEQVAQIVVAGKKVGRVEVYFLKKMPNIDEGPFLKEERLLIDAVAERIGRALVRITLEHFLTERVKELGCLYGISRLIETHGNEFDTILQGVANILPGSWQYPEITSARIVLEEKKFVSDNFKASRWRQGAAITVDPQKAGAVEVYYSEEMPEIDEGPFLKEERLLIDAVAERIGRASERIKAEHQLDVERTALKNMNIALHEVLAKVQDEKKEMGDAIQANVDKIIMPILHSLEIDLPPKQRGYVMLLKGNLEEISSPFTNKLSKQFMSLTPTEIQICNMIKKGFPTKEIAKIRHISPATVSRYREYIRKKLGLANKNVNLTTYLHTFMSE